MTIDGEEVEITPQTLAEELIGIPIFLSLRSSTVTHLVYAEFICQLLELWALRLHTTFWLGKARLDRIVYTRRAITMILCKIGTIVLAFMTSRANSRRLKQLSVTPCSALEAVDHTFSIISQFLESIDQKVIEYLVFMILIFLTNVVGIIEKCYFDRSQEDAKEFDEDMKRNSGGGPRKRKS